jgi:hypothetical protein
MAKVRIVIDNVQKAHDFEIKKYKEAFERAGARPDKAEREARKRVGQQRPKGTVHAEADLECPDEMPNCRNCGDPDFKQSCREAGHCPDCGTKHGVAPDSVVAAHGFVLEE